MRSQCEGAEVGKVRRKRKIFLLTFALHLCILLTGFFGPCTVYTVFAAEEERVSGNSVSDSSTELERSVPENKTEFPGIHAFIPYEGRIIMVLAANVVLDKNRLFFGGTGETDSLIATVLPANALIKDVMWSSSNSDVATVDADGVVTAVGEGETVITVKTVSPYNATASCTVTVGTSLADKKSSSVWTGKKLTEQAEQNQQSVQNPQTGSRIVWVYVAVGLSVLCMLASVAAVFLYHNYARVNEKEIGEVIREVVQESSEISVGEKGEPGVKLTEDIQIDFQKLKEINTDTAGWIVFHNQCVNYPLVQTDDNSYYLNHSFRGEENRAGSIFMDCRNNSFEDRNVVIYGHSMLDHTMFGPLKDVFHKKFWEEEGCDLIYLFDTDHCMRKYQIFSYYIVEREDYYVTTLFTNDTEYTEFLEAIQARSFGKTGIFATAEDHILTLSTCAGVSGTGRRVIHAKLL